MYRLEGQELAALGPFFCRGLLNKDGRELKVASDLLCQEQSSSCSVIRLRLRLQYRTLKVWVPSTP
jgi:hypothetical protein